MHLKMQNVCFILGNVHSNVEIAWAMYGTYIRIRHYNTHIQVLYGGGVENFRYIEYRSLNICDANSAPPPHDIRRMVVLKKICRDRVPVVLVYLVEDYILSYIQYIHI